MISRHSMAQHGTAAPRRGCWMGSIPDLDLHDVSMHLGDLVLTPSTRGLHAGARE